MILEDKKWKKGFIFIAFFLCAYFIWGQTKIVFENVFKPEEFYVEGNRLYVSEHGVIQVYSLPEAEKLFQLTEKGEGPGEFKLGPNLTFLPQYIVASGEGKLVFYSLDGKKLNEKKTPANLRMLPVKNNYISDKHVMNEKLQKFVIKSFLYDTDFKEIALLNTAIPESSVFINRNGTTPKQDYHVISNGYGVITDGKNICIYDSQKGFYIDVFDSEGKKISSINKEYPKIKVTSSYKDKKMEEFRKDQNWSNLNRMFNFIFPDYFPAFRKVRINDGFLYILTDTPKEEEQKLVVMDFKGKIHAEAMVPNLMFLYFYKGSMYYFEDSEDEKWVLHILKILK